MANVGQQWVREKPAKHSFKSFDDLPAFMALCKLMPVPINLTIPITGGT